MSADNATFVATFPNGDIRVGYGYMSVVDEIDTHYYTPEEAKEAIENDFGESEVFHDRDKALLAAHRLEENTGPTEYGVTEVTFLANFGELRDPIPEPPLPDGACVHCSHVGGTISFHAPPCERDPSTPIFMIRERLMTHHGINAGFITREVMDVLNENFTIEPKA